jgi:malonyl CoA-acyl carrier protein transacylase
MSKIALVFPGQGSQRPTMAQDFFNEFSESKDIFNEASEALSEDMQKLCFEENEKLNLTEFTQPAILTAEIAIFNAIKKHQDFQPEFFGGHSLGEYTALVAAGVIPFGDACKIVRRRGALMQDAVPKGVGAMAAIIYKNIQDTKYTDILKDTKAELANNNSPEQVVISGKAEYVEAASEKLKSEYSDMSVKPLNVSAPFHCELMKKIEPEFNDFLQSFSKNMNPENAEKVVSNYTGTFHKKDEF